jgi:hypothetical protein
MEIFDKEQRQEGYVVFWNRNSYNEFGDEWYRSTETRFPK